MGGILAPCSNPPSCCQNPKYWLHQQAMSSYCKISSASLIITEKIWTTSEKFDTNYMNTIVQKLQRSTNIIAKVLQTFTSGRTDGTRTRTVRSS